MWGFPLPPSYTPGWEGAGEVVDAGKNAKSLIGKRVAFGIKIEYGGSWCEYVVTERTVVIPLHDDVEFEVGASSIVNPLTAIAMVDRLKELKVKTAIITACASQLGGMVIKICKKEGIKTIGTVRRAEQVKVVQSDHVINTGEKDWDKKMLDLCKKLQPTGMLECIAGDMFGKMMNYLSSGGTAILYGCLSEKNCDDIDTLNFIGKNLAIEGFLLG